VVVVVLLLLLLLVVVVCVCVCVCVCVWLGAMVVCGHVIRRGGLSMHCDLHSDAQSGGAHATSTAFYKHDSECI
jgi:hypothetical protein